MKYNKKVKVYRQGAISIGIPSSYCEMLNLKAGDELMLSLDTETKQVTFEKIEKQIISFKELPVSMQKLLQKVSTKDNYEELKFEINPEGNYPSINLLEIT